MNENELLSAIEKMLDKKLDEKLDPIKEEISSIHEQLKDIETSIEMIADWADNVAVITKVPFASGQTSIK